MDLFFEADPRASPALYDPLIALNYRTHGALFIHQHKDRGYVTGIIFLFWLVRLQWLVRKVPQTYWKGNLNNPDTNPPRDNEFNVEVQKCAMNSQFFRVVLERIAVNIIPVINLTTLLILFARINCTNIWLKQGIIQIFYLTIYCGENYVIYVYFYTVLARKKHFNDSDLFKNKFCFMICVKKMKNIIFEAKIKKSAQS